MAVQVLVADGSVDDRVALVEQLGKSGYETTIASSIPTARAALKQRPFDVLILEAFLPDGDSLLFCNEIREQLGQRLVIIFVGSRSSATFPILALELGADDVVAKPWNTEELIARIESRLRRFSRTGHARRPSTTK